MKSDSKWLIPSTYTTSSKPHQRPLSTKNSRGYIVFSQIIKNYVKKRSHSENKPKTYTKKQRKNDSGFNKLEEITARFNHSPITKPHSQSPFKNANTNEEDKKTATVQSLIDTLYKKINFVADSTKKFMSSAEKLSRYCEFSRSEAKKDLKNYINERNNIEKELTNLVKIYKNKEILENILKISKYQINK